MIKEDKQYLWQFLPRNLEYLTKEKKINYCGINLKTDYLINIIHELILKYYFTNEINYNLWSVILRKKYGKFYSHYIDYLVEKKFMVMISNYYVGRKAKTYKLNIINLDIIRHKVYDTVLLNKHKKEYLYKTFVSLKESSIPMDIRKKLVEDLYHIQIDADNATKYVEKTKDIELNKYLKNINSIESISTGHIFFKFDSYGRFHTNFTVLKRFVRQNYLKIDNEETSEIDIRNSQPFFFGVFLKNTIGVGNFNPELHRYVEIVKNGLLYDEILEKYPTHLKNRNAAKLLVYKVLFGNNSDKKLECKLFKKLYPTVYQHIVDFKNNSSSYKELSHELQSLESNCIFDNIVTTIKNKYPYIRLFTVHDSIVYPSKYKNEVELVFNNYIKNLL